jgi:hypothetical protein
VFEYVVGNDLRELAFWHWLADVHHPVGSDIITDVCVDTTLAPVFAGAEVKN